MKVFYKTVQLLFIIGATIQIVIGKVDYAIFSMIWAVILELLYIEKKDEIKETNKIYDSRGEIDNSNLEDMIPKTNKSINDLTLSLNIDFEKFRKQINEDILDSIRKNKKILTGDGNKIILGIIYNKEKEK